MLITLLVVTLIASSALGYVYELTKEPIRIAKENKVKNAVKAVLPEFDQLGASYKLMPADEKDSLEFFPAYAADGHLIGTAVKTFTNKGFGGYISIMVGITAEGKIHNYAVLEHKETPGLGTKMAFWFNNSEQPKRSVLGRNPKEKELMVSKDGGDIDAITAATISSRAFLDAVNRAAKTLATKKELSNE